MSLTKGDKLFIIQNCNCKERMKHWRGALLGQKAIGCGVNVMVFLDLLHQNIGLQVIPQLDPQIGTDIQHMIDHMKQYYPDKLLSRKDFLFHNESDVKSFLDLVTENLKRIKDPCLIVKLNRATGVGHSVIMTYHYGKLYTIDPQQSKFIVRNDDKIFRSWSRNGFIGASVIIEKREPRTSVKRSRSSGSRGETRSKKKQATLPSEKLIRKVSSFTKVKDLSKIGKIYLIMTHGNLKYEKVSKSKGNSSMPSDSQGNYYDFKCLKIPRNVVLHTLTNIGDITSTRGSQSFRSGFFLGDDILSGKYEYEEWGDLTGKKTYQFPNYFLSKDNPIPMKKSSGKETHLPMASCGIFYKKDKSKPERIFDIQSAESKQCFGYHHEPFQGISGGYSCELDLEEAIQGIISHSQSLENPDEPIFIYTMFCLSGVAPESEDKIKRCTKSFSSDKLSRTVSRLTASLKKKKKSKRKRKKKKKI